jgi:hypothetical protein
VAAAAILTTQRRVQAPLLKPGRQRMLYNTHSIYVPSAHAVSAAAFLTLVVAMKLANVVA